jgi:hypothetical protein
MTSTSQIQQVLTTPTQSHSRKHVRQRYLHQFQINLKASRQSPPPEEQDPKQGQQPTAKGKVDQDQGQFDKGKGTGEEKKSSEKALEDLPSNPERKARV